MMKFVDSIHIQAVTRRTPDCVQESETKEVWSFFKYNFCDCSEWKNKKRFTEEETGRQYYSFDKDSELK